jgi:hypothetical protein
MAINTGVNASKLNAVAVLQNEPGVSATKLNSFGVLARSPGVYISKVVAYGVVFFSSIAPSWPSFAFVTGVVGLAYTQAWDLSPATSPTTYTLASGSLPPGLTLSNVSDDIGQLSGTPTAAGTFTFTLTATNAVGSSNKTFTVSIISPASINPVPVGTFPNATINIPYSQSVGVSGGVGPYTYAIAAGSLPTGLSLDTSTGVISGTATVLGSSLFTIQVTDSNGNSGQQAFSLNVVSPANRGFSYAFIS